VTTGPVTLELLATKLDSVLERMAAPPQRFLTVDDTATYTGLSVESVRKLLAGGKLRALRPVKGRIVIDRNEIDSLVLSSDAQPRVGRGIK
jgi:excisionase family DNA binding protein